MTDLKTRLAEIAARWDSEPPKLNPYDDWGHEDVDWLLARVAELERERDEESGRADFCVSEISKLMARIAELERLVGAIGVYGPTGGPP